MPARFAHFADHIAGVAVLGQAKTDHAVVKKVGGLWLLLVLALSACGTVRPSLEGQASFDLGLTLFNQGKFQEAIPYFQRATAESPNFAEAYLYLGRSQLSIRRWREAIQPLRTAYRLAPEETKQEVFNILMDALVAAALDGFGQASSAKGFP